MAKPPSLRARMV